MDLRPVPPDSLPRVPDHEILKQIGSGSYGGVWLARSVGGQLRAVKVVWRRGFSSDRPYEREFTGIRQFEPISRSHPGVVNILHVGRDERAGYFYYVMELADAAGEGTSASGDRYEPRTLASDLDAHGRLPLARVLPLGVQLADALGHIHRHELVHRDVKPSNVIFVGGQAKLADIGLVAGAEEAKSFVGTEGFIPPEGPGSVRADLFGLGRLLYEAATGKDRCEFPDLPEDLTEWKASERAGLLELNEILARACAPNPSQRHANAAELAADLNVLLAGRSIRHAYGIERRLRRATRLIGFATTVALIAFGGFWLQGRERRAAEQRTQEEAVLRRRAEAAEQQAREHLRDALLLQALATTSSSEIDRRNVSLEALKQAASIRPGLDLRNAALAALTTPQLHILRRWDPRVGGGLALRPDAGLRRYARRNDDGSVSVHAMDDDRELVRLPSVAAKAVNTLFSPDGSLLAVKYRDSVVRVWSLSDRSRRLQLASVKSFEISPDGTRFVATCLEGHVHVLDLASGREIARSDVGRLTDALAIHPSEPLFLVAGDGRPEIEFRRMSDGALLRKAVLPPMGLVARWSADGRSLITTHLDFSIRVWDWPDVTAPRLLLRTHRAEPVFLATDPAGRWLVTGGWDSQTNFFDLHDGRLLLNESSGDVHAAADRPVFLLAAAAQWTLVDFEPEFGVEAVPIADRDKSPVDVAFCPGGRWLATAGPDGIRLLDRSAKSVRRLMDGQPALRVAFNADATRLVAVTPDGLRTWRLQGDPSSGSLRAEQLELPGGEARGYRNADTAGIFDRARRWVLVDWHSDRWSWIFGRFDPAGIESRRNLPAGGNEPDVSPDGRWIAWGNWHGHDVGVKRLDTDSPTVVLPATGSANVAFTPDNRLLAVGSSDQIRFYEVGSWRPVSSLPRVPVEPLPPHFAFTADARICVATLPPHRLLLIDTSSGTELATLPAGQHILARLAFSPDDRWLAAASTDHIVLLWDLPALRSRLRELGLDWQDAPSPSRR